MHQNRFLPGPRPRPRWGSLQRSPGTLAGFKGLRLRKGKGGEERALLLREGEGRKGEGREGPTSKLGRERKGEDRGRQNGREGA